MEHPKATAFELVIRLVTLGAEPGRRIVSLGSHKIPERFIPRRLVAVLSFAIGHLFNEYEGFASVLSLLEGI